MLVLIGACAHASALRPESAHDARPAWDALVHALPGQWTATAGTASVPVRFDVIAGGSVVLETFGRPGRQTSTTYHLDGRSLVATHYCAQGNQPRLRLRDGDARHPHLALADVTGRDPDESVLVELGYDLGAAGGFDRVEVYQQPDGTLERTLWHYAPVARPSDADVIARSRAFLDAYDRGDVAALEAALAPGLLRYEGGAPQSRAQVLDGVRARKPNAMAIAKRTWDQEKVTARDGDVVFAGLATEEQAGNDVHGGYLFAGWYMLQWVHDGTAWRVATWTWQRKPPPGEGWNEIYRNGRGFNREPNRLLVDTVRGVRPGRALDLGMGQGRNALYLASQGWKVTGVDLADEGLKLAREQAAAKKLPLEAISADLATWDFGTDRWDLITQIYCGSERSWIERIKPALRKGGLYVIEYFANDQLGGNAGFRAGELAKLFGDGFEIVRDELVEDVPDWAMNRAKLVRFVARKR